MSVPFEKVPVGLPCPGTNDFLYSILVALTSARAGSVAISQATPGTTNGVQLVGVSRTPAITTVTDSSASPVAAGAKYVGFIFSSDFAGAITGAPYAGPADASQDFTAPPGDTLAAIGYTITAGTLRIVTII